VGYVAAPELSSQGDRARNHGIRGSVGAHLSREARSKAEEHVAAPELNLVRRRGHGTRGSTGAHLGREARSEAEEHVEVPELTSIGRSGPELQGTWQRVDACLTPCLDLKLVCRGSWFAGYRQT
jgi:hypothetical protein